MKIRCRICNMDFTCIGCSSLCKYCFYHTYEDTHLEELLLGYLHSSIRHCKDSSANPCIFKEILLRNLYWIYPKVKMLSEIHLKEKDIK